MRVSAVIPVYNTQQYITDSISSIIEQTLAVDEIIIVDDGSTDNTLKIIKSLQAHYKQITVIEQVNAGASAARNTGLKKAKGDWVLFLDADDVCSPNLLEIYSKFLSDHVGQYVALYSQALQIDESGRQISGVFQGFDLHGQEGFIQMLIRNPIISPSGSIVQKSIIDKLDGFDTSIKYAEDVDFWLRVLLSGESIGHVTQPLSFIRRHTFNTTSSIDSTKIGENVLLNKFGLQTIKDLLYMRNYPMEVNQLDYANFLIRFDEWEHANTVLDELEIDSYHEKYVSFIFAKSLIALHNHNYVAAKEWYHQIIRKNSTHGAALNNIAVICAMSGLITEARDYLQSAISYYPGYIDAIHNISLLGKCKSDIDYKFTKRELRDNLLRYI